MGRDSQRQKLYRSEWVASPTLSGTKWGDLAEIQRYVDQLVASPWFQEEFDVNRVMVRFNPRLKAVAKGSRGPELADGRYHHCAITLPRWAWKELVVLHEVAHCVTPDSFQAHGIEFAANLLKIVEVQLGTDAADELRGNMTKRGVKFEYGDKHTAYVRAHTVWLVGVAARSAQLYGDPDLGHYGKVVLKDGRDHWGRITLEGKTALRVKPVHTGEAKIFEFENVASVSR